MIRHTEK
jgi:putative resolvase